MPVISKVLVANRGEIACRVLRTATSMGFATVAVYSDADRGAPHVALADESVHIGGARAQDSYLDGGRLLRAARATGADAIHPGYGFLSENAAFAEACRDAGVVFVGPSPDAIRVMGDKAAAKKKMEGAAVGPVPGYAGADQSLERLSREAARVGYPLLVKAVAGGGGRGIRVVHGASELADAVSSAQREAESAFGDGTVLLERFVAGGRHVEIQVFADTHGNAIFLGERDCSTQRRRQKVIEEAPSPHVTPELRATLGRAAIEAARSVDYVGAGTVEFIVDPQGTPFFLEMNTRLQVEHPVTECITGLDLVRWQLLVAEGKPLPITQADVRLSGHAIEARLYTEDPYSGFAPQTGVVTCFEPERATALPGVRVDAGIAEGSVVSPHYDAMVAKVIAHGATREEATRRLVRALTACPLGGVGNNRTFLVGLLQSAAFGDATITTTTLDEWVAAAHPLLSLPLPSREAWALAFVLSTARTGDDWFRSTGEASVRVTLGCDGQKETASVERAPAGVRVVFGGGDVVRFASVAASRRDVRYAVVTDAGAVGKKAVFWRTESGVQLACDGAEFAFVEPSPFPVRRGMDDPGKVVSPLAGLVAKVLVDRGSRVTAGETLGIIEAMKMETRLSSRVSGVVTAVHRKTGDSVEAGALLFEIEQDAPGTTDTATNRTTQSTKDR